MTQTPKRKQNRRLTILYIALSGILLLGTLLQFTLPSDNIVTGNGTITFDNQSGGFYGIVADGGIQYDPINLDQSLDQDKLRVTFVGKIRSDLVNAHQWGTMLELTKINQIP
jgi:hypothetical protein